MIKFLAPLLAAALSVVTEVLIGFNSFWLYLLFFIIFFIGYMLVFAIIFFAIAFALALPVNRNKKPTKYSPFYHRAYTTYCKVGMSIFGFVMHVKGLEKVPNNTNFLMIQNHISNFDPIVTNAIFGKYPMIFVSKSSLFKVPAFGRFIHKTGYISLTRINQMKDKSELYREKDWLERKVCSVCVYPEGTRNKTFPNPIIGTFKGGSFGFARSAQIPVVVTAIRGTEKAKKNLIFSLHHVYLEVLDVINYDDYKDLSNIELADSLSERIKNWIIEDNKEGFKTKIY